MKKNSFFYRNGLSIVLFLLMFAALTGQVLTGWKTENNELAENAQPLYR